jgi:hypothetical protein
LSAAVGDRVPEDLPGRLQCAFSDVSSATRLDSFYHPHQFGCLNLRDRLVPEDGDDIYLQPAVGVLGVTRALAGPPVLQPLCGDGGKGIFGSKAFGSLVHLALLHRVDAVSE